MPGANNGLKAALARSAAGAVVALSEISADDLLAGMTDEQKAALAAELAPAASAGAAATPPVAVAGADANAADDGQQSGEGGEGDDPAAAANASERDRVKAVAKAVAEDDTCKGKASLALAMLADDDYASLSASGIVKLLGKQAATEGGDAESAARSEMREAIAQSGNSNIDASGGSKVKDGAAQSASVWDSAIAKVYPGQVK